jgi:mutator protein MutT
VLGELVVEERAAVGVVVVDTAGHVLLVQRRNPPGAGTWTILGGKLEEGEEPEQAAEREVREETGLVVRALGLLGEVYLEAEGRRFRVAEVLCRADEERPPLVAGDDAAAATWAALSQLDAHAVEPLARAVLALGVVAAALADGDVTAPRSAL